MAKHSAPKNKKKKKINSIASRPVPQNHAEDAGIPRLWAVYRSKQPSETKPSSYVNKDVALLWMDEGWAKKITANGEKEVIRLTPLGESVRHTAPRMNDLSCKPGTWLLDGCVADKAFALAVQDAWQPKFSVISLCQDSL